VARKSASFAWFLRICLFLGLAFLYIPLLVLVVYSFNRSELVTVWGGFSTKWYGALLNNSEILEATWLSIRIALISSAAAVVLGTMAAYALARIKRFRGSTLFTGMVSAPMVMPDIITGISLVMLILQVQALLRGSSLSWLQFERGWFTIWLGHTTLCMAYVTVVIRTRLGELVEAFGNKGVPVAISPPDGNVMPAPAELRGQVGNQALVAGIDGRDAAEALVVRSDLEQTLIRDSATTRRVAHER